MGPGKGVDVVCPGQDYTAPARSFDVVISCEMMEHNPNWRETWLNMLRMVREDGLLVMTCASIGRKKHGTSDSTPFDSPLTVATGQNYYRNLVETDFTQLLHHDALLRRPRLVHRLREPRSVLLRRRSGRAAAGS